MFSWHHRVTYPLVNYIQWLPSYKDRGSLLRDGSLEWVDFFHFSDV